MKDSICLFPDPVLRKKIPEFKFDILKAEKTINRLKKMMSSQKHGIGIAAPQIGIRERIALVDVSSRTKGAGLIVLINPKILKLKNPIVNREGCMSVPEYTAYVKRYEWVEYEYLNEKGDVCKKVSEGIEAICVQHEIDHLDGKLFIDHISCLKTDLIPRK